MVPSKTVSVHRYDVVVIGGGGAGLRAAIGAADSGARTAVLSKSLLGKSQTVMGAAVAAGLNSHWATHFSDTLHGARGIGHWRMAQLLAQEAPGRVLELEGWGALFDRGADGLIRTGAGSGHRQARLVRCGNRTGSEILRVLQEQVVERGIDVFTECVVVELLVSGGRVSGAVGYRKGTGAALVLATGALVLATGGIGKLFAVTSNLYDSTGDGHALAYRAGAELADMEFVQFHPTGMVWPPSARGLLVAESIRNYGGVLLNARGERFLFKSVPSAYRAEIAESPEEADRWHREPTGRRPPELLPRDELARAISEEIQSGRGTSHGGVILEIASRRPAAFIRERLPHMVRQFEELAQLDITKEPIEVAPTCHYAMGGVRVAPDSGATTVSGLFAAGEVTAGLHGANRLNGNGMTELIVFGRRAGEAAALYALEVDPPPAPDLERVERAQQECLIAFARGGDEDPSAIQRSLQECMQRHVGLTRSETGLRQALREIAQLAARRERVALSGSPAWNPAWQAWLDLRSMLLVAEIVVRSALARRESRGAHLREDYPHPDPTQGQVNVTVRRRLDGCYVSAAPVPQIPEELARLMDPASSMKEGL